MPPLLLRLAPHLGLAGLLVITSLAGALKVQSGRIATLQGKLAIETALHEGALANIRAAQAKAQADHLAAIARLTSTYRSMKDDADRQTDRLAGDFAARVLRLPAAPADRHRADASAVPGSDAAPGADGSGRDSVLLARGDALICATNTARLTAAHDWAADLAAGD